jgi:hypothetical protein
MDDDSEYQPGSLNHAKLYAWAVNNGAGMAEAMEYADWAVTELIPNWTPEDALYLWYQWCRL